MLKDSFSSVKPIIPCLIGPTAVGKSAAALVLAQQHGWHIISADSRQVYRFLDVGTAKPTAAQLAVVPHHFINIRNPDDAYSAGEFAREARAKILEIVTRGSTPVVVGGSGLYIRALAHGFFEPPVSDRRLQRELKARAQREGGPALHAELARVDRASAARLHPNDAHRIVRALEVYYCSGTPLSEFWQSKPAAAPMRFFFIGLTMPRPRLYEAIDLRVDAMLEQGLITECRRLLDLGYSAELNSLQTFGYKEAFAFRAGKISYEQMAEEIKRHTRNYAKRQLTWFRKDPNPLWIEIGENDSAAKIAQAIAAEFDKARSLAQTSPGPGMNQTGT